MSKPVRSECPTCHEVFNSVSAFDFHRVGPYTSGHSRRCLTPAEMWAEGLRRDARGIWDFDPARPKRASQADLAARYSLLSNHQAGEKDL